MFSKQSIYLGLIYLGFECWFLKKQSQAVIASFKLKGKVQNFLPCGARDPVVKSVLVVI